MSKKKNKNPEIFNIKKHFTNLWIYIGISIVCYIILGFIVNEPLDRNDALSLIYLTVSNILGPLIFLFYINRKHNLKALNYGLNLKEFDNDSNFKIPTIVGLGLGVNYLIYFVLMPLNLKEEVAFSLASNKVLIVCQFLIAAVIAPILEEIIFRQYLFSQLKPAIGVTGAAVISSLLFAMFHSGINAIISLFVISLLCCNVLDETNNIIYPIAIHIIINSLSFLMMFAEGNVYLLYPIYGIIILLVIFAIFYLIKRPRAFESVLSKKNIKNLHLLKNFSFISLFVVLLCAIISKFING